MTSIISLGARRESAEKTDNLPFLVCDITPTMSPAQDNSREEREAEILANQIAERLDMTARMQRLEREAGIRLTPRARLMLLLPLSEMSIEEYSEAYEAAYKSLKQLLETTRVEAARADLRPSEERGQQTGEGMRRSCRSVVKALWRNFC